jgi:SPP1 gp7 family putative phage head morphogenesis protein
VTRTVEKRIRRILTEALADGDTTIGAAQRLRDVLPRMTAEVRRAFKSKTAWSQAIARTETNKAASMARFEQFREAGIDRHQWVTARDEHVRDTHIELDGQIRRVGESFKPNLTRPMDPDAPAAEVVQCRCVLVAVIE